MAWYRDYFPPSKTIAAKGGIKARSKRGAFATSWWGRRWLDVLETLNLGGRLQRARTYARKGQVLNIDIEPGSVHADVQGSRPKPYRISIGVKQLAANETQRLAAELAKSPYFLAKLMTREMPQDIETLFAAARVSLFPSRASELRTDCSCPDWSNPCKHIAAVYYLLGEEFDRDPFLLLSVRGISRDELAGPSAPAAPVVALPVSDNFWEGTRPTLDLIGDIDPRARLALLERLGPFPFWRSERSLAEVVGPILEEAARSAGVLAG